MVGRAAIYLLLYLFQQAESFTDYETRRPAFALILSRDVACDHFIKLG